MTKLAFLEEYRKRLQADYPLAQDQAKVDRVMNTVQSSINSEGNGWNFDGPRTHSAWRAIGGKGRVTLKALRNLE